MAKIFKIKNNLTEDERQYLKRFRAHCLRVSLLQQCDYAQNRASQPGYDSTDNPDVMESLKPDLFSALCDKASIVDYHLSFKGYCKLIWFLVKKAFGY